MINWQYAKNFGELPSGEAEQIEALTEIAEQLANLNNVTANYLDAINASLQNLQQTLLGR